MQIKVNIEDRLCSMEAKLDLFALSICYMRVCPLINWIEWSFDRLAGSTNRERLLSVWPKVVGTVAHWIDKLQSLFTFIKSNWQGNKISCYRWGDGVHYNPAPPPDESLKWGYYLIGISHKFHTHWSIS